MRERGFTIGGGGGYQMKDPKLRQAGDYATVEGPACPPSSLQLLQKCPRGGFVVGEQFYTRSEAYEVASGTIRALDPPLRCRALTPRSSFNACHSFHTFVLFTLSASVSRAAVGYVTP